MVSFSNKQCIYGLVPTALVIVGGVYGAFQFSVGQPIDHLRQDYRDLNKKVDAGTRHFEDSLVAAVERGVQRAIERAALVAAMNRMTEVIEKRGLELEKKTDQLKEMRNDLGRAHARPQSHRPPRR